MTFCDMEVLYRHKKGAFNCKLSFPTLLTLIENSSFHFILIFDGVVISSKIRDDSTFWLHVIPLFFYRVYSLEEIIWNRLFFFNVLCGKVEKITKDRFWLQKVVKIRNQYDFWKLWTLIYMNSTVIFRVNPLWKDLQLKPYFSLAFYP